MIRTEIEEEEVLAVRLSYLTIVCVFLSLSFSGSALSQTQPSPTKPAATTQAGASNQSSSTNATAAKKSKPKSTRTIEAQLSGFTSQYADQIYARVAYQEQHPGRDWYVRGSYSRTATGSGKSSAEVDTIRLDLRHETPRDNGQYNIITGVVNRRVNDYVSKKDRESGYHLFSYGIGKQLDARNKGDIGLGLLETYDSKDGTRPAIVCSILGKRPLNNKLTLDSYILALQPLDRLRSTRLDSDIGLSYALADGLAVRLSWSANNLVKPIRGDYEWDSIIRLTVSFKRVSTR